MILVEADAADCPALARTSKRAFDADAEVGALGPGGPPGYDSAEWHQAALNWGRVFRIDHGGETIGGAIVFLQSPSNAHLGRIWLVPEAQNQGLGRQAMAALESRFEDATRWTLDTPVWNTRNHHFYARCGYQLTGRDSDDGVLFEKRIETRSGAD